MPYGYHGKVLHVDLTRRQWHVETPPESFYRTYMGGSGFATYYLLKEMAPGVDPLGPDNVLVFALSILTGVPIHGNSRATAAARSPLTGAVGDAQAGGFWPAEAKFAGYDAIVLKGRADKPVYLWISDGQVELRDAAHLWGMNTGDALDAIRAEVGDDKAEVTGIGPAGENGVRYAAIINMANRAHGRTGMGAVMGSKNLKAIAVRGKQRPKLHDRKTVLELSKWGAENQHIVAGLGKYGTANIVESQEFAGGLPTFNFSSGTFAHYENITGPRMYDTILKERDTCYSCATKCKRVVEVKNPDGSLRVDPKYGGPEYEGIGTLGSYCGIGDLTAIAEANQWCNAYGLDVISCGATIAWAMECYQNGLLTPEDTNGLDLRFGNAEAMVQAVHEIAHRRGRLGQLLAEGSARAADILGKGHDYLITAKGQEAPAHMPHVKRSLGLIYAVNPFGADHMSSEHDPAYNPAAPPLAKERLGQLGLTNYQDDYVLNEEKVRFAFTTQNFYSALDTLGVCQFDWGPGDWQLYGPAQLVELVRAVTGWDVTLAEIMTVGERRTNLLRAFNAREGIGRDDDRLAKRLHQALKGGASDGVRCSEQELEQAKDHYYRIAGWDVETGMPQRATLEALQLGWVADQLHA